MVTVTLFSDQSARSKERRHASCRRTMRTACARSQSLTYTMIHHMGVTVNDLLESVENYHDFFDPTTSSYIPSAKTVLQTWEDMHASSRKVEAVLRLSTDNQQPLEKPLTGY